MEARKRLGAEPTSFYVLYPKTLWDSVRGLIFERLGCQLQSGQTVDVVYTMARDHNVDVLVSTNGGTECDSSIRAITQPPREIKVKAISRPEPQEIQTVFEVRHEHGIGFAPTPGRLSFESNLIRFDEPASPQHSFAEPCIKVDFGNNHLPGKFHIRIGARNYNFDASQYDSISKAMNSTACPKVTSASNTKR